MNAKRKSQTHESAADEQAEELAEAESAAEDEGMSADTGNAADGGIRTYDPDKPQLRPGQATSHQPRDDQTDRAYRASQGRSFAGEAINASGEIADASPASTEHKPAEPTAVMSADQIRGNPLAVAKPGVDALKSGLIPGAGDPQNGVVMTDPKKSPISWVDASRDVAQHYPLAEKPQTAAADAPVKPV